MLETHALTRAEDLVGGDDEDTALLQQMHREAVAYLRAFRWCKAVERSYFGLGIGGIVAVFLFELDGEPGVDRQLWVLVGDLPSAYLVIDEAPDAVAALERYCELMEAWVDAVRAGDLLDDVFPVDAEASEKNATLLESRVRALREDIVPQFTQR